MNPARQSGRGQPHSKTLREWCESPIGLGVRRCLTGRSSAAFVFLIALNTGCRPDMFNQPRGNPLRESKFFKDGAASRPIPPNTIARGFLNTDEAYSRGMIGTNLVTELPFPITREVLERGRDRFEIHCSVCHGRTGEGNGMIPQRGFPAPPSYHIDRLRQAPAGHFFDVITPRYGGMYPY